MVLDAALPELFAAIVAVHVEPHDILQGIRLWDGEGRGGEGGEERGGEGRRGEGRCLCKSAIQKINPLACGFKLNVTTPPTFHHTDECDN